MKLSLIVSAVLAASGLAFAGDKHEQAKAADSSKEFQLIKSLAGDWKGTTGMGGKTEKTATSFRVTSGGSAVVETMGAGTPHEMVNVYHVVEGKLMMTHYCAIGNAPQMKAVKADASSITFEAVKGNGINLKKTPHMHGLTLAVTGKDQLAATWTSANMGEEHKAPAVFNYKRRKS